MLFQKSICLISPYIYIYIYYIILNLYQIHIHALPLDINRLIDPIQQYDEQEIENIRRIKSVFNVPVLTSTPIPKCPIGTQRITQNGECIPTAPKVSTDEIYLFNAIQNYYKKTKPTQNQQQLSTKHRRRSTTTSTTESTVTKKINGYDESSVPVDFTERIIRDQQQHNYNPESSSLPSSEFGEKFIPISSPSASRPNNKNATLIPEDTTEILKDFFTNQSTSTSTSISTPVPEKFYENKTNVIMSRPKVIEKSKPWDPHSENKMFSNNSKTFEYSSTMTPSILEEDTTTYSTIIIEENEESVTNIITEIPYIDMLSEPNNNNNNNMNGDIQNQLITTTLNPKNNMDLQIFDNSTSQQIVVTQKPEIILETWTTFSKETTHSSYSQINYNYNQSHSQTEK